MAGIDFSALPKESSINMGSWFKAFGYVRAIVIIVLIFGFGIVANIYTTPVIQSACLVLEVVAILAGGYMVVGFNKRREAQSIQQFAAANGFEYQAGQTIATSDLPDSVSSRFTAKTVKLYYRVSGQIKGHDFELFHVKGLYYSVWNRGYVDVIVLEAKDTKARPSGNENIKTEAMGAGGARIILSGNALSAEDMESVFTAAGIS
jgi:hypothetical protein